MTTTIHGYLFRLCTIEHLKRLFEAHDEVHPAEVGSDRFYGRFR